MTERTLVLGALAPDIIDQGWADSDGHFQKDADAIARLRVRGLIADSVAKRACDKLAKRVFQASVANEDIQPSDTPNE